MPIVPRFEKIKIAGAIEIVARPKPLSRRARLSIRELPLEVVTIEDFFRIAPIDFLAALAGRRGAVLHIGCEVSS
jgi:hypothetical protein